MIRGFNLFLEHQGLIWFRKVDLNHLNNIKILYKQVQTVQREVYFDLVSIILQYNSNVQYSNLTDISVKLNHW